jgi:hypothetical protein
MPPPPETGARSLAESIGSVKDGRLGVVDSLLVCVNPWQVQPVEGSPIARPA